MGCATESEELHEGSACDCCLAVGAGEGSNRRVSYRDMLVHDDEEEDADMDVGDDDSPEATPPPVVRRPVSCPPLMQSQSCDANGRLCAGRLPCSLQMSLQSWVPPRWSHLACPGECRTTKGSSVLLRWCGCTIAEATAASPSWLAASSLLLSDCTTHRHIRPF